MGTPVEQGSGIVTGKANLDVFSSTLQQLAETDKDIVVVTSDSRGSGKLTPFAHKFPRQIVEIGIPEQNLVGVAAGLALSFVTQPRETISFFDAALRLVGP